HLSTSLFRLLKTRATDDSPRGHTIESRSRAPPVTLAQCSVKLNAVALAYLHRDFGRVRLQLSRKSFEPGDHLGEPFIIHGCEVIHLDAFFRGHDTSAGRGKSFCVRAPPLSRTLCRIRRMRRKASCSVSASYTI